MKRFGEMIAGVLLKLSASEFCRWDFYQSNRVNISIVSLQQKVSVSNGDKMLGQAVM